MEKRILIISPHPDDAVLSLGAHLLHFHQSQILVWNLFSRQDYTIRKSTANPRDEILQEDQRAAKLLGFQILNEDYEEAGLRGYHKLSEIFNCTDAKEQDNEIYVSLIRKVNHLFQSHDFDSVYIPLGCGGHIDHMLARDGFLAWYKEQRKPDFSLFLYEDLPYGANGNWLNQALEIGSKYKLRPCFLEINQYLEAKLNAVATYQSQIRKRDIKTIKEHSFDARYRCAVERTWEMKLTT